MGVFEKGLLVAGTVLASCTILPGLAKSLGYREIPVGVVPHPSQANLVLLQQGKNSGVRIGDRGTLTLQGYAVTESARFESTEIPFTVVELNGTSATARLPISMPSLEPISAAIRILDIQTEDLHPPRPNLPPVPLTSSDEQSAEWFDSPSFQICGVDVGGAFAASRPSDRCARVTREDLLVQAIVSGQDPVEVAPADAVGATALHRNDRRLMDVVRFHFLRPATPRARVAIAQEYIRFHHYQQAINWLAPLSAADVSDPRLADAVTHARMYAAYQSGDYTSAIEVGKRQVEDTTARLNLVAAAHYQQQDYAAALQILSELPPLEEVLNNRAIAYYQQDRSVLEDCGDDALDAEESCLSADEYFAIEARRQQQARPLLGGIPDPEPVSRYNRAVLDIQRQQLSEGMETLLAIHRDVAGASNSLPASSFDVLGDDSLSIYDPALNQLKLELLQYVSNHDDSMSYLAELSWNGGSGLPSELGDAVGLAGSLSGVGSFLPFALFNLVSYATEQERAEALIEVIQLDLTALYADNLDFIPLVTPPDPMSINPFSQDAVFSPSTQSPAMQLPSER
ncbi:MAG: tetratricopeptide repeat protein [Synechococcus sp.]